MKSIPTIDEITEEILDDIESADTSKVLLPKAVWRILAKAIAGVQFLCYKLGLWLYNQIFTLYMDDDALAARGAEYSLTRTPAVIWKGTAKATGTDDTVIESGKLCTYGDYAYEVLDDVTISDGEATLSLKSLDSGDDVNLDEDDELEWSTPQTGLDTVVTITETTQSGEDQEKKSDFRTRILTRQRMQTQAGTAAWWVSLALEIAGLSEAFAYNTSPGVVSIYPLTDDDDPENRIPGESKLTEGAKYLSDTSRRLFLATVNVLAFTELSFDITITGLSTDTTAMRTSIKSAIEDYLYARRPTQYDDEVNPKNVVSTAEITSLLVDAGATTGIVTLKYGSTEITSKTLLYYQLAKLGTLTWEDN